VESPPGRSPTDFRHQPQSRISSEYHHHPLPFSTDHHHQQEREEYEEVTLLMRSSEAANIHSGLQRGLYLLLEDPSSSFMAMMFNILIASLIIANAVVMSVATLPSARTQVNMWYAPDIELFCSTRTLQQSLILPFLFHIYMCGSHDLLGC
jgi:hypothetical protein